MKLFKKINTEVFKNAMNEQVKKYKSGKYVYINCNKQELYGDADEILATNKKIIGMNEEYFDMRRTERLKYLDNYLHCFRTVDELLPIYDPTGNGVAPIAFEDENGDLYDIFYDKTTMELIPNGAFSYPQVQIRFIAPPGGSKTVKCLATPQTLALIGKYYDGFCINYDYPIDSKERVRIKQNVRDFQRGKLPERNKVGEELEPIPIRIDSDGKTMTLEVLAGPGEEDVIACRDNGLYGNPNIIPVLLIPARDYVRMADGETETEVMEIIDRFIYYGLQRDGAKKKSLVLMIAMADLLKGEKNVHIQNILAENTIGRDEDGRLILHDEGVLDLDKLQKMQEETFAYIKETNSILFNKLQAIKKNCEISIFVTAELNQEVEGLQYNPKEITPFRTDEFWLYLLYLNGMVKAKRNNQEEVLEKTPKTFTFDDFLNLLKGTM